MWMVKLPVARVTHSGNTILSNGVSTIMLLVVAAEVLTVTAVLSLRSVV